MLRDFDSANKTVERALKIDPQNFTLTGLRVKFALAERGDLSVGLRALEFLNQLPESKTKAEILMIGKVGFSLLQRKPEEALRIAESIPDDQLTSKPELVISKYLFIGGCRRLLHDEPGARAAFTRTKPRSWRKRN